MKTRTESNDFLEGSGLKSGARGIPFPHEKDGTDSCAGESLGRIAACSGGLHHKVGRSRLLELGDPALGQSRRHHCC